MQLDKIGHQYSHLANQTLEWLPMDTKSRYDYNHSKNFDLLSKNNWLNRSFSYSFNSHGFRCDEFAQTDNIVFLGCSYTCGIGLPYDETWTYKVAKNLGYANYNLGIGGTSLNTAFRLGHIYIPALKPKIVILLEPDQHRLEILNLQGYYDLLPNCTGYLGIDDFYKIWISNDLNSHMNRLKNVLALEHICLINNAKFYSFQIDEIDVIDKARDLGHAGTQSNSNFADYVLKKMA